MQANHHHLFPFLRRSVSDFLPYHMLLKYRHLIPHCVLRYMPVTEKAFELLPEAINNLTNEKYKSLYQAFIDTQNEYTFYCAPQMDSYLDSEMKLEKNIRMKLTSARKRYMNNEADIETLVWDTFQEFSDSME